MGSRYTVGGMDEQVAEFVLSMNPMMELGDFPYTAIGQVDQSGKIIGGCVLTNYTKTDVHGHLAGVGNWLTRRFLGECFRHIFVKLGCVRCTGIVAASNERAQAFDEGLGFVLEGRLRRFLPNGEDALIYGMLYEECRWLNVGELKNGRERTTDDRRKPSVATLRCGSAEQRTAIRATLSPARGHGPP